jgi:hypothetical protein
MPLRDGEAIVVPTQVFSTEQVSCLADYCGDLLFQNGNEESRLSALGAVLGALGPLGDMVAQVMGLSLADEDEPELAQVIQFPVVRVTVT